MAACPLRPHRPSHCPHSPCHRRRACSTADDHGAAAVGYAGVVVLACALGVALFGTTDHGRRLLAELERAVCIALDLGDCASGRRGNNDLLPKPCTTDTHRITASTGLSVAASPSGRVRIGERVNSNGTAEVALTRTLDGSADAPSPFRWGFQAGPVAEAELGISAGVHGGVAETRVWTFASRDEARRFRERVARAEHLQNLGQDSGAFDALGAQIVGKAAEVFGDGTAADTLPPPDRRETSTSAGAHLTGEAGVKVATPDRRPRPPPDADPEGERAESDDVPGADPGAPGSSSDSGPDPDAGRSPNRRPPDGRSEPRGESGEPHRRDDFAAGFDLLHLVSAGAEGSAVFTRGVDHRRGTTSRTVAFEFAESGDVGPLAPRSVLGSQQARNRLTRAALTTTRNRRTGELTGIRIETVRADEAHGHVVGTARLAVTDANRGTVRRWLAEREPVLALSFLGTTGRPKDATSPRARSPGAVTPFDRLLFDEGTYSTVRYAAESNGREFAAEATLAGLSFGSTTGWESATLTATGARYLAPPGPRGRRELVPFGECAG
ncbi:hypothetical protein [Streptomonospora litoralis]|uniref:Uncharacterized protein n=1 Tax=Streptomonospora litoralis TaxID=2498135 RepID=A0A4P6Q1P8_9ACTN|nr:hypothetical protein [Streptomonospora litoralis]QBI53161.1 hypothetical protein EKD16_06820 [Streptomonospora litoralis]